MPQVIHWMLPFAGMAGHVSVPHAKRPQDPDQAEDALFPVGVKDRLLTFGLGIHRAKAVLAAKIMRAVHESPSAKQLFPRRSSNCESPITSAPLRSNRPYR